MQGRGNESRAIERNLTTIAERGANGIACCGTGDPRFPATGIAVIDAREDKKLR
jgi:hypothetical protein